MTRRRRAVTSGFLSFPRSSLRSLGRPLRVAALCAFAACCGYVGAARIALGQDAPPRPAATLTCRVDPAVELLSVLTTLAGPRGDRPPLAHAYAREALDRFGPYADHLAVRRAAAIADRGLEDFVAQVAARVGPPPGLVERPPIYAVGDGPVSVSADTIRALVAAARDFARRTSFMDFYREHAALYRTLCDRVLADSVLATAPTRVARFFGLSSAAYELVLMPLVPRLGVAPPGVRAGPRATLTAYVGPAGGRDGGDPVFRTGWSIERVVLHEFAHQHVNSAVYGAASSLARSRTLLAPVRARLWRADHVASWPGAVTETVVRAAVAEMRGDAAGDAAERDELREQRTLGFSFVDSVAATLRTARRPDAPPNGTAPNVSAHDARWWPGAMRRVVAMLDRAAASPHRDELSDPPFDAGMAHALIAAAPDSVLIILPTEERDAALQDSLRAHVERMRDRFVRHATIVTDREALARDFRGWTLWAIGTLDGNAWLRAHAAELPVAVDRERIVTDSAYRGEGLVFVGAQPSPLDARRALIVTVGQRVDELARGWWIFSSDYAVVDGTRVLTRGTYTVEGGRRRFVPTMGVDTSGVVGRQP
ncbi:DUF4932 domain-containing protein [Gemmatirosa kalamazoonensis]|uniref:DUF4932 domain-containing protein n=1 Tax=Gemmatirosa kalamazoonensis TaxID=861299 RepID=UPI00130EBFC0|nr:DUF4932 domain-containing protein [Gemmatirosa kalamazoonensis]